MWCKICTGVFLSCVVAISSGVSYAQTSEDLVNRLNNINLALKEEWKAPSKRVSLKSSAEKIWDLLDTALVEYLNSRKDFRAEETNQDLKTMLGSTLGLEKRGWTANIQVYDVGNSSLCLAVYDDFYLRGAGTGIFTFRILEKANGRWKIVSTLEQSDLENLYMRHQEVVSAESKRVEVNEEKMPQDHHRLVLQLLARTSISNMGITISTRSIRPLPPGGFEFVTILTAVSTIGAESLVKWVWSPVQGLKAISWVWGDQWIDDQLEIGKWHSLLEEENGKTVRLKDFR